MRNFLSTLFFSLFFGGVWGQVYHSDQQVTTIKSSFIQSSNCGYLQYSGANYGGTLNPAITSEFIANEKTILNQVSVFINFNDDAFNLALSSEYMGFELVRVNPANFCSALSAPSMNTFSNVFDALGSSLNLSNLDPGSCYKITTYVIEGGVTYYSAQSLVIYTCPSSLGAQSEITRCSTSMGSISTIASQSSTGSLPTPTPLNVSYVKVFFQNTSGSELPSSTPLQVGTYYVGIKATYADGNQSTLVGPLTQFNIVSQTKAVIDNIPITYITNNLNSVSVSFVSSSNAQIIAYRGGGTLQSNIYQRVTNPSLMNSVPSLTLLLMNSNLLEIEGTTSLPTQTQLNSSIPTVGSTSTYTFRVVQTVCLVTDKVHSVFRLPTPQPNAGQANQTVCSQTQINQLSNPGTVINGSRSYTWAIFNTISPSALPMSGTETVNTAAYYVRYKLTENGTDYYSDTYATINVTVMSPTAGSISAPSPWSICSGTQPGEITSATSGTSNAGAVSYQWQTGLTTISGATTSTYTPGVLTATTSYQRRTVATSGSTVCYSAFTNPVEITVLPTPPAGTVSGTQTICSGSTPSQIHLSGHSGSIQWQSSSDNVTFANISGQTQPILTTGALTATTYYRAIVSQGSCTATSTTGTVTVNSVGAWIGGSGTITPAAYNIAANWCGGTVPTSPTIPPGVTVYLDGSFDFTNITVECGGSLIITESARVLITNVLTNGGLVQVINGGIIKFNTTQNGSCPGTYKITEIFTPSRLWYVGPTTTNATRSSFGAVSTAANNGTTFWSWNESTQGYTTMTNASAPLTPGIGYVYRNNEATNLVVDFQGPYVTSNVALTGLGRLASGASAGFHLVSNPYTAYIDANKIFGTNNEAANPLTSGMQQGIWVRSQNPNAVVAITNPQGMVFDTYNANNNQAIVLSANPTGNASANARYIAPMQGFWVRTAQGQTGSLGFTYAMTDVNPSGAGQLRNTSTEEIVARINVNFGNQKDQMLAILSPNAQNGFEGFDSEKMFIPGIVQVYAPNSGKKLVINSVRNNKSKISMPVAIECPANGWYNFELAELEMTNGILFLEDKVQGTMHNLGMDAIYSFFSNSGVVSNRFVLHFHLPTAVANPSGPSSIDDLVSETQNAVIDIRANGSGKVNVSLDMVDEETNSFVRIYDMNGRMLESFQIDGSSFEFQMNHGQGIYLVEVSNGLTVEKKKVFVQ